MGPSSTAPPAPDGCVLHARLAARPRDEWVAGEFADSDPEWLAVSLSIGAAGIDDSDGELSLWAPRPPTESADPESTSGAT